MKKKIITLIVGIVLSIVLVSAATFVFQINDATFPAKNQTFSVMENLTYDCDGVSELREVKKGFQAHEMELIINCKGIVTNIQLGALTLKENQYGDKCFDEVNCKKSACKQNEQVYDSKTNNCIEKNLNGSIEIQI